MIRKFQNLIRSKKSFMTLGFCNCKNKLKEYKFFFLNKFYFLGLKINLLVYENWLNLEFIDT